MWFYSHSNQNVEIIDASGNASDSYDNFFSYLSDIILGVSFGIISSGCVIALQAMIGKTQK